VLDFFNRSSNKSRENDGFLQETVELFGCTIYWNDDMWWFMERLAAHSFMAITGAITL
jgi:hypothetical protein